MKNNDDHIKSMRWLYDDEKTYRKAATKLKLEELKASREKELIRQYRKRQRRIWHAKAQTVIKPTVSIIAKKATSKPTIYIMMGFIIISSIAWGGKQIIGRNQNDGSHGTLGESTVQPDFKPIAPKDGSPSLKTTENNQHKIVSYQDTIGDVQLIVSQQKLPEKFAGDPQAITKLEQFSNAESLQTPKGKIYITTNLSGQQYAAIAINDLLIFFQSNKSIKLQDWNQYITDLKIQ